MHRCNRSKLQAIWLLMAGLLLCVVAVAGREDRVHLLPQLHPGDTLSYESHARLVRRVKTKSNVATMMEPGDLRKDLSARLQLSVQDMRLVDDRPMLAAETLLNPVAQASTTDPPAKPLRINFTIGRDGSLARADGLEDLDPEQRLAWQYWVSQFAFGWTLPPAGVKLGEKWRSVEPEKTPSPIAKLEWERESSYVENDKCPVLPSEECAVFLTDATLRQKSSPENATPEDFALHQLKTSGTAKGRNESVLYISRKTGLLLRATEDIQQSLEVTIEKADASNGVHYQVDVTSHFETAFVPPNPSSAP